MPTNIRNLPPLERGGVENRQGIDFQDYVAASFFLDMLLEPNLSEVWCESLDDITLIWNRTSEEVEFVQVKKGRRNWTPSSLYNRDRTRNQAQPVSQSSTATGANALPATILERSLANDRLDDGTPVWFRLVTVGSPNDDLAPLLAARLTVEHLPGDPNFDRLCQTIRTRLPNARSANGNDVVFWLQRTLWEPRGKIIHVENENLIKLDTVASTFGEVLHPEHKTRLLKNLLRKVFEAGKSDVPADKRFLRGASWSWIEQEINQISQTPIPAPRAGRLYDKMQQAGLLSYYDQAFDDRLKFKMWRMNPGYMPTHDTDMLVCEVRSELTRLQVELETGQVQGGLPFYRDCLSAMKSIKQRANIPETSIVDGCMHDIAGRCAHRYAEEASE